jgi:hypothetical protein
MSLSLSRHAVCGSILLLATLAAASCSSSSGGGTGGGPDASGGDSMSGGACTPGDQKSCACAGSSVTGAQVCNATGTAYGACSGCPSGGGDGGGDSSTSPESGSDTGTSDVTSEAAAFSPTDLSTLVVWLEGDVGVTANGNSVTAWANQVSNGVPVTPGGCTNAPTTVSAAANGHGAVNFSGSCMTSADDQRLQWASDDFIVEAVVRVPAAASGAGILWFKGAVGGSGFDLIASPGSQSAGYFGDSNAAAGAPFGADGAFHVVGMRRVGTNIEVRVNGQATIAALTAADSASEVGSPLYIGVGAPMEQGVTQFVGDVAEIVAVHGTTSDVNVGKLEQYFKQKYALP